MNVDDRTTAVYVAIAMAEHAAAGEGQAVFAVWSRQSATVQVLALLTLAELPAALLAIHGRAVDDLAAVVASLTGVPAPADGALDPGQASP